jgi:hypothetical protein|tara:strand:- start:309 stop:635 length:327 start_codon:yes stop_codon:yes gene_type:complete
VSDYDWSVFWNTATPIMVAGGLFLLMMLLLWFLLPFSVFGIKPLLRKILWTQKRVLDVQERILKELEKQPPTEVEDSKAGKDGENGKVVEIRTPAASPLGRWRPPWDR